MTHEATAYRWADLEADRPMAGLDRRCLRGAEAMLTRLAFEPGVAVPVHAHASEQFTLVLEGRLRFTLPDGAGETRTIEIGPGAVLHVPGDAPHGTEAIEPTRVICLFAPPGARTGVDAAGEPPARGPVPERARERAPEFRPGSPPEPAPRSAQDPVAAAPTGTAGSAGPASPAGPGATRPATAHRWADLVVDHPMERLDRRRLIGAEAMLSHLVLHQGFAVPVHAHANEQFAVVLGGCLRFTLPSGDGMTRTIDVHGGEVLHLPPNVPHGAEAIETTTAIDVFAPPSAETGVDAAGRTG